MPEKKINLNAILLKYFNYLESLFLPQFCFHVDTHSCGYKNFPNRLQLYIHLILNSQYSSLLLLRIAFYPFTFFWINKVLQDFNDNNRLNKHQPAVDVKKNAKHTSKINLMHEFYDHLFLMCRL